MDERLILEAGRVKDGLRVLVTGGGSGIGASVVDALRSAGAKVFVCDIDPSTSPDHVADISQGQQVEEMFRAIERDLGGLDVLVNNVGLSLIHI